jgi:hypothetical protein
MLDEGQRKNFLSFLRNKTQPIKSPSLSLEQVPCLLSIPERNVSDLGGQTTFKKNIPKSSKIPKDKSNNPILNKK